MAKRGFFVAVMVLGAVTLAAVSLWYALTPPGKPDQAQTAPKPPPELSADAAKRLFSERGRVISPAETRPPLAGEAYAFLVGGAKAGSDAGPFFRDLFAGFPLPVAAAILNAEIRLDDGRVLPPVPIAVMAGSPDFRAAFLVGEQGLRLSPLFSVNGTAKATISLSLAYVPNAGDTTLLGGLVGEAESLFSFLSGEPGPLWTSPGRAQLRAQAFADRLAVLGAKTIDGVMVFDILLQDTADSRTRRVELVDAAGQAQATLTFQLASHAPLFAAGSVAGPSLAALAALPADGGRSVGDYLASRAGTDLGTVLMVPAEELTAACAALRDRLIQSAGFGKQDTAIVLMGAGQVRSLFAKGGDAGTCVTAEDGALVEKAGFPAPVAQPTKPAPLPPARQRRFDAAADQMAKVLSPSVPAALKDSLSSRFAPGVALFDSAGFWLTAASSRIVQAKGTTILPAAVAAEAVQILGFLPVARLGCPTPAADKNASRRTLLVELEQDQGLWQLDLAFDESDRVAGVSLAPAAQADYCRAMAARRGGASCPFAGKGHWRDIQPGKC